MLAIRVVRNVKKRPMTGALNDPGTTIPLLSSPEHNPPTQGNRLPRIRFLPKSGRSHAAGEGARPAISPSDAARGAQQRQHSGTTETRFG